MAQSTFFLQNLEYLSITNKKIVRNSKLKPKKSHSCVPLKSKEGIGMCHPFDGTRIHVLEIIGSNNSPVSDCPPGRTLDIPLYILLHDSVEGNLRELMESVVKTGNFDPTKR
jgi:hypothetical protein